jgi:3-hydroxyisobutyrate dehydrogenase-like beta-hydroxyacid dehydrogenase
MNTDVITPPAAVTVIGLGNMGVPMAACLLKAGFQVTGFDLSEAARAKFQAAGGRVAATVSDAVKTADVVITLLPDGKIACCVGAAQERLQTRRRHCRHELVRSDRHSGAGQLTHRGRF